MDTPAPPAAAAAQRNQFGTFGGVFTPSILTIFGVIMFLRAGFVIGQAGVAQTCVILVLAELIVLATAVSMSAIATNTPVRGGGAYFLISRALGPQFGGAIGIALYLAQALSVPFYLLGFTQALVRSVPAAQPHFLTICLAVTGLLFLVNYLGADWAIKVQYIVMALLGLAILALLGGALRQFSPETLRANWEPGYTAREVTFWSVFAVYFPAVTGILAGVNMSGDLKDPARSLVRGTLAAITVGFVVYALEVILCGGSQLRVDLIERPYETLLRNALPGTAVFIVLGVFAATLSSAVGSFLGAPRVLQAVARDRVLPGLGLFGRGSRRGDEPRLALWLTLALALAVAYAGSGPESLRAFDTVAALVTMLFLATYGMINLAAFVEAFGANPSFRPRFRFCHWSLSLLGAAACAGAMLLIDAAVAALALLLLAGLYALISRRVFTATFGDARRGFVYALIRHSLRRLQRMPPHPKNWRPTMLVLSGNPLARTALVRFGVWLGGGRGLVTLAEIIPGNVGEQLAARQAAQARAERLLADEGLEAYPEVLVTDNLDEGIRALVQTHSIGPLKPNTVLLGWPRLPERVAPFMRHLRDVAALRRNLVCVVDTDAPRRPHSDDRIDVWWTDRAHGAFMLILGHLLTGNWEWKRSQLRLLHCVRTRDQAAQAQTELSALLAASRIDATAHVIVTDSPDEGIVRESAGARLVLLGFTPPTDAQAAAFFARVDGLARQLPALLLAASTGEADVLA